MSKVHEHLTYMANTLNLDLVRELIQIYDNQMSHAMQDLVVYYNEQNFEKSKFLSHKLKSSSRNTGSSELAELFSLIEKNPNDNLNMTMIKQIENAFLVFQKEVGDWLKSTS